MAVRSPQRVRYDTDLSDLQWQLIAPFIPPVRSNDITGGRPPKYERREIMNAILYVARTGCQWRLLPHDFPQWDAVYKYFVDWYTDDVFEQVNDTLRKRVRIGFQIVMAKFSLLRNFALFHNRLWSVSENDLFCDSTLLTQQHVRSSLRGLDVDCASRQGYKVSVMAS